MSFRGEDILPYIKSLADAANEDQSASVDQRQVAFRTVASRAYYSAFLEARSFLGLERDDSGSVHKRVEDSLRSFDRGLANSLNSLKLDRTRADYRLDHHFNRRNIENCLRQAKKIVKALRSKNGVA